MIKRHFNHLDLVITSNNNGYEDCRKFTEKELYFNKLFSGIKPMSVFQLSFLRTRTKNHTKIKYVLLPDTLSGLSDRLEELYDAGVYADDLDIIFAETQESIMAFRMITGVDKFDIIEIPVSNT